MSTLGVFLLELIPVPHFIVCSDNTTQICSYKFFRKALSVKILWLSSLPKLLRKPFIQNLSKSDCREKWRRVHLKEFYKNVSYCCSWMLRCCCCCCIILGMFRDWMEEGVGLYSVGASFEIWLHWAGTKICNFMFGCKMWATGHLNIKL